MLFKNRKSYVLNFAVILALLGGMFGVLPARASTVIHVKWNASGANNGTSWTDAYTDLQSALSAAISGDEIWVAAGTYKPTTGTDRTVSFTLKNGVAIYGGFIGTETLLTQRDPATNVTILSGDIGVQDNTSDNSYHVVVGSNTNNSAILDGFTITGGNANNPSSGVAHKGGGMYNTNGSPSLTNLIFTNNSAVWGGGIANDDQSSPILTNVTFSGNTTESETAYPPSGGGMFNTNSSPSLVNVTFHNNSAEYGGGLFNHVSSSPALMNVTFSSNSADYGGGMLNRDPNSSPTLTHVTMSSNIASIEGGTIANAGNPVIRNSILWGNTGGEILNINSGATAVTYSIVQGGYPGTGNLDADPLLGLLADNGGSTQTMALSPASPAIDAGDDITCAVTDQRRVTRPQGNHCDMGAYENQLVIHYVKWNASGVNNGTSWTDAYSDLQTALSVASSGDEIWVAAGTYKPTTGTDRSVSFALKNTVAIYGGFAGIETLRTQRSPEVNVTVLSGDIGVVGNNSDNSYHVVIGSDTDNSTLLDGFTVTAGNANLSQLDTGGGMLNQSGSPTVANVTFSGNSAGLGGGMYNGGEIGFPNGTHSHPILTNVIFKDNSALEGAGMENQFYSSPTLTNVSFINNTAIRSGGGMINYDYSSPTLTNVTFSGNTASVGGGVMNWSSSSPTLTNVTFNANSATDWGGGMYNDNGSNPSVKNVTFNSNQATEGGGMYNAYGSDPTITNSILYGNTGGAIFDVSGTRVVTYSIVQGGYPGTGNLDADPLLGSLADNGGFTQTMALGAGSPAIDAGDDVNCPATDQRGITRPQGVQCDIGAYEYEPTAANVDVTIAGNNVGNYDVPLGGSISDDYGINGGPVHVSSTNGVSLVASQRVAYSPNGGTTWTSYSELMGLPSNQLSSSYTFPFYNNVDINSQLRFGNVGTVNTTVTVTIGGVVKGSYNLIPNESKRISYIGLNAGPVKITSSGNVPIIASLRVAYFNGTAWTSFSEMMGLPSGQLTNGYIFPWYNNLDLNSQLRFANVGTVNTTVSVTIGGIVRGSYILAPNTSQRVSYPALDKGPVKVTSSSNVPIIASLRVGYFDGSAWTDFSEIMGLPSSSLSTHYSFSRYNNVDLNSQLRFGNAGNTTTTVTVTIGGVLKGSYMLAPNESKRVSYAGLDAGPVVIQSSGGVPIIASERVAYFDGSAWTSFAEMMGLPQAQLTTTYLFPWYNNVDLNTQLRFGIP